MAITTFLAVATSILVMAAWFVLPATSPSSKAVTVHDEPADLDIAA